MRRGRCSSLGIVRDKPEEHPAENDRHEEYVDRRLAAARELFGSKHHVHNVAAIASELLGEGDAEEARLRHLAVELLRRLACHVQLSLEFRGHSRT